MTLVWGAVGLGWCSSGAGGRGEAFGRIDNHTIVDSLCRLFEHWMAGGAQIPITPLVEYFVTTLSKVFGMQSGQIDRRRHGDDILIVDTNGDLYLGYDEYGPETTLGNIGQQTHREICASDNIFAARVMTVANTARKQDKNTFAFLIACVRAHVDQASAPSLFTSAS